MGLLKLVMWQFKDITIEPVIMLNTLGLGIINGAQIYTDLMYWKACVELGNSASLCDNITLEGFNDTQLKQDVSNYVTK